MKTSKMQCCVPFCRSSADTVSEAAGITFHEFPSEVYIRAAWLRAIGKQDSPLPDSAVVCSRHFLTDDIYETESGSKKIHSGAIPSTVQVCMICLDTQSKLFLMSKYKLDEAYEHLVGHNLYDQGYLKRTLCVQCAQRLVNFNKFRDKSLRANSLMMALVERHQLITIQHLEAVNEVRDELKYNIVKTVLEPDHCDLHIDCSDADSHSQIDVDTTTTREIISVKTEQPVPMSIDEDHAEHIVRNEDAAKNLNINLVVTKEEYLSDEEPNQMTDPLLVKPSTSKEQAAGAAPIKYEITFECSICSEEFADEDAYNYHMTRHMEESQESHNPTEDPSAEYGHSSVAPLNARLKEVFTRKSPRGTSQSVTRTKFNKTKSKSEKTVTVSCSGTHTDDKRFTCEICHSKYKHKLSLHRHMRTHTGEYPYTCHHCVYKCTIRSNLVTHVRTHTGERPFTCDTCEFKFARKCDLVKHTKTHTGEKPYACEICQFKFRLKGGLIEHLKTHTGDRPFTCELCDYKSVRNSDLVRHMKTHTGEKPFACELCEYKCIRRCNLAYHMTTHTGEKPFSCEICELRFSLKTNLRRHMVTHTGLK